MSRRRRRKRWSRRTKLHVAVATTALGITLLTAFAMAVDAGRDTDGGDPRHGLTARERDTSAAHVPPLRFTDVAVAWGLDFEPTPGPRGRTLPEDNGSGLAFGDYDGDGDPDLYVVGFPGPLVRGPDGRLEAEGPGHGRLLRNDGDRFTDVTEESGTGDPEGFGMGARFADHDGDGDLDLYVTNFGPNRLFENQGDGTFVDVAEEAGVADAGWSTGCAFGDFDRDGDLDLYVCNYVDYDCSVMGPDAGVQMAGRGHHVPFELNPNGFDALPNRLYENQGDGTYREVAFERGVDDLDGRSLAATFCDLDGDGWLDLYVNNDVSPNRLFLNLGRREGTVRFRDHSTVTGTADPRGSMGLSVAEVGALTGDEDGLPDLFISHWVAQENALYLSAPTSTGVLEYRDRTRRLGLGELSLDTVGWGSAFADLDLDGRPDLLVANGSTLEDKRDTRRLLAEPFFVFWNAGDRFVERAAATGEALSRFHTARGLALADFDGDGDLDAAVAVNRGRPLLLRNDTPRRGRPLAVVLDAPAPAAFGARVEVHAAGRRQVQWYGADASYLSDHDKTLVFGLGTARKADRVRVRFADGREVAYDGISAGRLVVPHPGP